LRPANVSRCDWLREPDPDAVGSPPLYMAFDLLYHERRDLTGRRLRHRRARLEDVVAGSELVFPVRRLAPDGLEARSQVIVRGYEGYAAKDEVSASDVLTMIWPVMLAFWVWLLWLLVVGLLVAGGAHSVTQTTRGAGARGCRRRRPLLWWAASTAERTKPTAAIWMEDPVMKTLIVALCCAVLLGGCAIAHGPVTAAVTLDMKGPVSAGPAMTSPKVGRSEAWGILVYATGDASISAAVANGGITRIHHVDQETTNILGIYARYVTVVHGE
jgi:TRL (tRNA-associated locus)-like protein